MAIGTLQETVTVAGDSPMVEVLRPGNVMNIDGEFQREMPIQARSNWSDFLELTPGVISRGFDDGSGRQVYFGHATEHFAHVLQVEGMIASNYHDAQVTYVAMGNDVISDVQVKTGGVDASSPMGVGMVMNVLTKSGGNRFSGSATYAYQPYDWNGNNVANCTTFVTCNKSGTGTPTTAYVRQFDGSFGGPIKRDAVWFFGSLRRAVSAAGISRTSIEVERIQAFPSSVPLFDNPSESWQPYVKVTSKLGTNHDVSGLFQRDRLILEGSREYNYQPLQAQSTGGSLYGGKVTSVWSDRLTSTIVASYNNKGGNDVATFEALGLSGPQIIVHQGALIQGGQAQGTGRLLEGGNLTDYNYQPASQMMFRGDLTYLGVRFDWVQRNDEVFDIQRQSSWQVGPRIGFSFMLTEDARNIIRGSYVRLHEQMMGRDAVTTFGGATTATEINEYDLDLNGTLESRQVVAGRAAGIASYEFDPNLHQPSVDEFILGFRKQFWGTWSADISWMKRSYQDMYARVDVNGIYPSGPNRPFGGFGLVDPNRGIVFQQTNNTWSTLEYQALEVTVAKNLSNNFQALIGINRQWQEFGGTWNPTDPARFIQPDAFASDKLLYMPRGNNEDTSLLLNTGTTTHTYGPTWQKYSLRFGGTYHAPYGVILAASYTILAGPWSGPIVDLLPANDPQLAVFGPATFRLPNGTTVANPLSTRMRFTGGDAPIGANANPTRGDGQVQAPAIKTLGLKIGKTINIGGSRQIELAGDLFNLLNDGNYSQYNYSGANERFNPVFLQMRNQQAARAFQATAVFRF
ncbi:MAG: hypothetical protein LC791_19965 [Acidobacteria bacterium]|nr:hypothetical protein [Acidobacteriota bacterium]